MPYTKTNWSNSPSTATPLSAANLNNLETQYDQAIADTVNASGDTMNGPLSINAFTSPLNAANLATGGGPMLQLFSYAVGGAANTIYVSRQGAPTNNKIWETVYNDTTMYHRTLLDSYLDAYVWMTVARTPGSMNIEWIGLNATSYVSLGSPNTFVNNLYVQAGYIRNRAAAPAYELWSDNSTGGFTRWQWLASANNMYLKLLNEAGGVGSNDIMITRDFAQMTALVIRNNGTPVITLNAITGVITSTGASTGPTNIIRGYQPHIRFYDTSQSTENKGWDIYNLDTTLSIRTVNDAETSHGQSRLDFRRSGNTLTAISLYSNAAEFAVFDFGNKQFRMRPQEEIIGQFATISNAYYPGTGFGFRNSDNSALMYCDNLPGLMVHKTSGQIQGSFTGKMGIAYFEALTTAPGPRTGRTPLYSTSGTFLGYLSVFQS